MSVKANPTVIGVFLLGAIALIVTGLMVFGGGRFFTETVTYVAYFPETVSGLNDGAPVNFRGVKVGSVRRIEVQLDAQDLSVTVPAYLQLQRRRIREIGGTIPEGDLIAELIERGLRAQLQLQSIVTGQLSVQLDILPDRPARYVDPIGDFPEMPTIPSTMQEFTETMESLSIQDMVNDAHQVLAGLKALVNSPELAEILTGINQFVNSGELLGVVNHADEAIGDVQALVSNIDGQVENLSNRAEYTLAEVDKTLDSAQKTLDAARQSLSIAAEGSPMRYELEQMLGELKAAARSIRLLAEYIERNPDALLRGKPGGS
ncbi:MAG: MCE family protein [Deltaproteobacteria bacterium]|nr:MCE family protein [Deltaproteobacteria bacterium]MBW2577642.1 MCE family protein [Deltaproteobacteria bacterium]MBW2691508.1 MCE family protein [Deltaproteobacteria bacterium]